MLKSHKYLVLHRRCVKAWTDQQYLSVVGYLECSQARPRRCVVAADSTGACYTRHEPRQQAVS